MTTIWADFTPEQQEITRRLFTAMSLLDELNADPVAEEPSEEVVETRPRRLTFHDLHALAAEPTRPLPPEIGRTLLREPRLRADFNRLLGKLAVCRFPRAAAAASGEITRREWQGFRITLKASRAEPSQTYVLIDLIDRQAEAPSTLFICSAAHDYHKVPLPEPRDGTIQLLAETDSPLVKGLKDAAAEVFLR